MISEKLLQFIWQQQYFNSQNLISTDGEVVQVLKVGSLNYNQGTDFLHASIRVNDIVLVGNIEVHIKASDWLLHNHSNDKNYDNVILHIVWENDKLVLDKNNKPIITVELQSIVPKVLLTKFSELMNDGISNLLPCKSFLPALSSIGWIAWKERLATERLVEKSERVLDVFKKTEHNWEETFWQILAYNFGLKNNTDLFQKIAETVSVKILAKHKNQIHQLEALLLGQANLLHSNLPTEYGQMLYKEYTFLQKKYSLQKILIQPAFLRMRPASFPTIRLAQLAMLIHKSVHLFSVLKEKTVNIELHKLFDVTANDYWNYHFTFNDDEHTLKEKNLGAQMINNIIINTIAPVFFAYGTYMNEDEYKEKSIRWLQNANSEKNTITKAWEENNIENKNAFDSQALIQLTKNYCNKKMCLSCAVGNKILSKN